MGKVEHRKNTLGLVICWVDRSVFFFEWNITRECRLIAAIIRLNFMEHLPHDRMPEAEVSLRLALYLIRQKLLLGDVDVAIDGAQVKNLNTIHFPMDGFLATEGLTKFGQGQVGESWQGTYVLDGFDSRLKIHSTAGLGDVVGKLRNKKQLRIESKKGKLESSNSSSEYPLIREAIGQIMTIASVSDGDLFGIAVPHSKKFAELCERWTSAPLIRRVGLLLLRVHRDGNVDGLQDCG